MSKLFNTVDQLLDNYIKSVRRIISNYEVSADCITYVPSINGAVSRDFTLDEPAMEVFKAYSDKCQFDLVEQAEVFEALMQVIAETPYITGFYPFNSHCPTPLPQSKLYAIWGKPAEQLISGWYKRFAQLGK